MFCSLDILTLPDWGVVFNILFRLKLVQSFLIDPSAISFSLENWFSFLYV